MSDVAGDIFAYGIAAGVSLSAFVGTVAMLTTSKGSGTAGAFLAGFLLAISGVCVLAAIVAGYLVSPDLASTVATLLKLGLGIALLLVAWRVRPREATGALDPDKLKALLARFDELSLRGAFGAGVVLVALPRRLVTTILAGLTIGVGATTVTTGLALTALYALTASVLIWASIAVALAAGARGEAALETAKVWFVANATIIVFGLSLLLGVLFAGQALISLAA